jgi:hypothetical protein
MAESLFNMNVLTSKSVSKMTGKLSRCFCFLLMSNDDKEFLKEFIRGGATVAAVMGMFFLFVVSLSMFGGDDPAETFKVVSEYGGCDVVRFAPPNGAEYSYFLDCRKVR